MTPHSRSARPRSQVGVTLIEVLVTVVLVSIGLLGFAGLQAVSLKSNRSALQHSYAAMYSYDIIDCMRANPTAAHAGAYNFAFGSSPSGGTIAGNDMVAWNAALAADLPNGRGKVTVDVQDRATVEICWAEGIAADAMNALCGNPGASTNPALQYFSTQTSL